MQQFAFEFELLIIVHAIENISTRLQHVVHDFCLVVLVGILVHVRQHLRVDRVGLFLELVVGVDLVALGLQQPGHRLRVDHVLLILRHLEGRRVLENPIVVDVVKVLAKQELNILLVLLGLQVVELEFHLVFLVLVHNAAGLRFRNVLRVHADQLVVLGHKIVLVHQDL